MADLTTRLRELRFQKVGESSVLEFSCNRSDGTGHMLRVYPTTKKFVVGKQKPKRDPNETGGPIGKEDTPAPQDEWHTLFVTKLDSKDGDLIHASQKTEGGSLRRGINRYQRLSGFTQKNSTS